MIAKGIEVVFLVNPDTGTSGRDIARAVVDELPLEVSGPTGSSPRRDLRRLHVRLVNSENIELLPKGARVTYTGFQKLPEDRYEVTFSHYPGGELDLTVYDKAKKVRISLSPNR